jgi:L-glutamine-phosphate cytidylyltransferase
VKAVVLAAGQGSRLLPLTADRPKPLVPVGGRPLLFRTLDRLAEVGVAARDVVVVAGYRQDVLEAALAANGFAAARVLHNPHWHDWQNFHSLSVAREATRGETVLQLDGDVLFDGALLPRLLDAPGPGVLATSVRADLDAETMKVDVSGGRVVALSKRLTHAVGESMGIARLDAELAEEVMAELETFPALGLTGEYYEEAYRRLFDRGRGPFRIVDVADLLVTEIDDRADLERAEALLRDRAVA